MHRALWLLFAIACGDNIIPLPSANSPVRPPHVSSAGGPVLVAPIFVPIFFTGDDDMQAQLEAFLAALAMSSYWTATTSEYGVGAPTIATSIVWTDAPPTTDDELQRLLENHFGMPQHQPLVVGDEKWPQDPNTLYVVFLPAGVQLSLGGSDKSCETFGGYHFETTQTNIVYALLPRCTPSGRPIDAITPALSHELVEAATDPHPATAPAFVVVDDPEIVWAYTPGGELGDMCEYIHAARKPLIGDYVVQRTWSNASAAAGHDPCVPALSEPYKTASPLLDEITFTTSRRAIRTRGIEVPNGTSATVELQLISDAPTEPWSVVVDDAAVLIQQMPAEIAVSLDKPTGTTGDKLRLTIKRLKDGQGGGSEFVVRSRVNDETVAMWWGLVTN